MEIYCYDTQDVYLEVKSGSTLVDADTLPTATITSDEPPDDVISRSLTVTKTATGKYKVPLIISDTFVERTLKITWQYVIGGISVSYPVYVSVVRQYSSLDELKAKYPTKSDADIIEGSRFAKLLIDSVTNRTFGSRFDIIKLRGNNKNTLVFREPILNVSKIYRDTDIIYDSSLVSNDMTLIYSPTGYAITSDVRTDPQEYDQTLDLFNNGKFYSGHDYIVHGRFGYDFVPEDIKQAHRLLVNDWFCSDTIWKKKYIESQDVSEWKVKFDSRAYAGTGNFFVDAILEKYTLTPMVVL